MDILALKALITVEAQIKLKLESLTKPSQRYRTLFYGLKRNHPHSAAVMHPLMFLLRRILYSAIVIYFVSLPIVAVYVLIVACLIMLAYVIVEKQWEDSLISWQHIFNEVALYLVLLAVIGSTLPIFSEVVSPVGWFMITVFISILIFNLIIIAF